MKGSGVRQFLCGCVIVVSMLCMVSLCHAADLVRVYGDVKDTGGHPVPEATVRFVSGDFDVSTLTDSSGFYEVYLWSVPTSVEENSTPASFILRQNYPNPFNPSTTIEYELYRTSPVRLDIYDILGRRVRTLVNNSESAGVHAVVWDGCDNSGNAAGAGVYLYRFMTDDNIEVRKMLLLDGGVSIGLSSVTKQVVPGATSKNADVIYTIIVEKAGYDKHREGGYYVEDRYIEQMKNIVLRRHYISIDREFYRLEAYPDEVETHPGHGGVYVLVMTPKELFSGDVELSIEADPVFTIETTGEYLSMDHPIQEVTIKPDTTLTRGVWSILALFTYEGAVDTLELKASCEFPQIPYLKTRMVDEFNDFLNWIKDYRPDIEISADEEWYVYNKYPGIVGGASDVFLNDRWSVTVNTHTFYTAAEILLRPRCSFDPIFAAGREEDGTIHEISIDEFGIPYGGYVW